MTEDPTTSYDRLLFESDPAAFDTPNEAYAALTKELDAELGLYYWMKQLRSRDIRSWSALETAVEELIEKFRSASSFRRFVGTAVPRSPLDDAILASAQFQMEYLQGQQAVRGGFDDIYRPGRTSLVRRYVETELANNPKQPVEELNAALEFLASQRDRRTEGSLLLLSSLLGGIAGSAATVLVS